MNARGTLVVVLSLALVLCAAPLLARSGQPAAQAVPLVCQLAFGTGEQVVPLAPDQACRAPHDHARCETLPHPAAGPAPMAASNPATSPAPLGDDLDAWPGDDGMAPSHPQGNDGWGDLAVSKPAEDRTARIDPLTGGMLVYTDTQGLTTTIQAPAGAVSACTDLVYTPLLAPTQPLPPGDQYAHHAFLLYAYPCIDLHHVYLPLVVRNGTPAAHVRPPSPPGLAQDDPVFQVPVTMTIHYSDADVAGIDENTLRVVYWTGFIWADMVNTCLPPAPYIRDPGNNAISLEFCHMSQGALVGN